MSNVELARPTVQSLISALEKGDAAPAPQESKDSKDGEWIWKKTELSKFVLSLRLICSDLVSCCSFFSSLFLFL
jgi:hypothetical protein